MGLTELVGAGPVAIDTAVFIYFAEEHPDYLLEIRRLFAAATAGSIDLVTSAMTLLEGLVVPYRAGNHELAARYEALLSASRGLRLVDMDRAQLRAAAQLRAHYRVRTPDAFQLAAALTNECTAFVTNERDLPAIIGLNIIQLSQLS